MRRRAEGSGQLLPSGDIWLIGPRQNKSARHYIGRYELWDQDTPPQESDALQTLIASGAT
ncbi:hypothetical protein GCM10009660_04200 [Catellatospora bangladeshensis]